jgi:hypothetical protein
MPSSYQVVLWKQESFVVLRPLQIEFFRSLLDHQLASLHYPGALISPLHVRREKALDFSGCNSRPGTGSLRPVATETTAEVTKRSELSV